MVRIKTLGLTFILLFLLLIGQWATPTLADTSSPYINVSLLYGPWDSTVSVTGSGFTADETGIIITYDGVPRPNAGIKANEQGDWNATITIPFSSAGTHTIDAYGSITAAANVPNVNFVIPTVAITLDATSAVLGSPVTVTGSGFGAYETGIAVTYDTTTVASNISATDQGTWYAVITIPASSLKTHTIDAYGAKTTASSVPNKAFTVPTSTITVNTTSGASGSSVKVTGVGFGYAEKGITITFDNTKVSTGITANDQGAWNATFKIPASESGQHNIGAYGSTTLATSVPVVTFTVSASISISKNSGVSGSSVTVTGSGFDANETMIAVTFDGDQVTAGITASSEGTWNSTFNIPASTFGSHSIGAHGSSTSAASVPKVTFTVGASISISQSSGASGNPVTVNGSGFGAYETGITVTYNGNPVASGIMAGGDGTWESTFNIPASVSGSYGIRAYGPITHESNVPPVTFSVSATVSLNRSSGASGSSITVTGSGFGTNETGITITYDGLPVAAGITASNQGTWTGNFIVSASTAGPHNIGAYGSTTPSTSVSPVIFIVSANISLNRNTGPARTSVTVSGSGFGNNETEITVTYDGTAVASGITASDQGTWNTTFNIPSSAYGSHSIKAHGSTTQVTSVGGASFNITPAISISPDSGYVGTKIRITGSGFSADSTVTFAYDDTEITIEQTTIDGSVVDTISVPKSKNGDHILSAIDEQGNEAKTTFAIESITPDPPSLLSPKGGSRLSILGNIKPTLKWSAVTNDPNGVTYVLQIDTNSDFSDPILNKDNISSTSYKLKDSESLSRGHYYWRVKAVDSASNEGTWSQTLSLKSGLMAVWTLILIILLCIAVLIGIVYYIMVMLQRRRQKTVVVTDVEMPTALGEWRESRPEEPRRLLANPWRKALPRPSKTVKKQLSPEDQARFKLITDFAQSLPLAEPGFTVDWMVSLLESSTGTTASHQVFEQLLQDQIQVRYEPGWASHNLYQELITLLGDHPIVQELGGYVEAVNRCSTEGILLIREIYRECLPNVPSDFLSKGGWTYISGIYSDTTGWFRGKSLQEPSERDYAIKQSGSDVDTNSICLLGAENSSFSGSLINAQDENEAQQLRALHLELRRSFRNSEKAKQLVGMITQLQLQRERLLNTFRQISRPPD